MLSTDLGSASDQIVHSIRRCLSSRATYKLLFINEKQYRLELDSSEISRLPNRPCSFSLRHVWKWRYFAEAERHSTTQNTREVTGQRLHPLTGKASRSIRFLFQF